MIVLHGTSLSLAKLAMSLLEDCARSENTAMSDRAFNEMVFIQAWFEGAYVSITVRYVFLKAKGNGSPH